MYNIPSLTENDIRSFLKEPRQPFFNMKQALLYVVGFTTLSAVVFGALNAPALLYVNHINPLVAQAQVTSSTPQAITQAVIPAVKSTPTPSATPEAPSIPSNSISIANLGISAPITWNVSFDEKTQSAILPNSTIQLAGTAHPGQHGVIAVSGHSSNYPWIQGAYNTVFAPLVKTQNGQLIEVNYNNKLYRYQVIDTRVIKATETDYLVDNSKDELRLFTCWPIGTSISRFVVFAKQVYPNPSTDSAFTASLSNVVLPSDL
jgi:LPXTG-site transpeptidase (sortase) family protein